MVGTSLSVSATVTGCPKVTSLSLFDGDTFLKRVTFSENPTEVAVSTSELGSRFPKRGVAAQLSLTAQARCSDGRSGTSAILAVRFLPVERVLDVPGEQLLPNVFEAEGGKAGQKTTFLGCIGYQGAVGIGRLDEGGNVLQANTTLPFVCSVQAAFSDRNDDWGVRWMLEPGVGVVAFDDALTLKTSVAGPFKALHMGPTADAFVVDAQNRIVRIDKTKGAAWTYTPKAGQLLSIPIVGSQLSGLSIPLLKTDPLTQVSSIVVERIDPQNPVVLDTTEVFQFPAGAPDITAAAFDQSASRLFLAYRASATGTSEIGKVVGCNALSAGCTGANLAFLSGDISGRVLALVPYQDDALLAAVTQQGVSFFNMANGQLLNRNLEPLAPSESRSILGVVPGRGSDFFVLAASPGGWATELFGVDSPQSGEVLRFQMGGGQTIQNSLMAAVDDGGTLWLRVGLKHVKALPMATYRNMRNASP